MPIDQDFYKTVYSNSPVPALIVDSCYDIISVNHAASDLFAAADLTGRPVVSCIAPEHSNFFRSFLDSVLMTGKPRRGEFLLRAGGELTLSARTELGRITCSQGEQFVLLHFVRPFRKSPENRVRDVNELKRTQARLEKANDLLEKRILERSRELETARQQVLHAEKLAAIGQLSASIAHEFNNPLQGVMTVLQGVARRAHLETEDEQLVQFALQECTRMTGLIKGLQDFNRPSSGRFVVIDLHQLLDSLFLFYTNTLKKKNIRLITEYAPSLPLLTMVRDQLQQVIMNLMNNAADACPHGGTITVRTRYGNCGIELDVQDTGVGIPPENMSRLFEPFFTTKAATRGTGLGLAVCYGIVKKHRGTIRVDSELHKGSCFTVRFPLSVGEYNGK